MPRFFFNIRDSIGIIPDDEGMEFPDVEAVRKEARQSAKELLAQAIRARHALGTIEVADEDGTVIEVINMRDLLD